MKTVVLYAADDNGRSNNLFDELETTVPEICPLDIDGRYVMSDGYFDRLIEMWREKIKSAIAAFRGGNICYDLFIFDDEKEAIV